MKSSVLENSADTVLDLQCLPVHVLLDEGYFETIPLIALRPTPVLSSVDEEDLYTSFEEAISGRARAISRQLEHLSTSGYLPATNRTRNTDKLSVPSPFFWPGRFLRAQRSAITLGCLGLSLLLLGFDLMGLLILCR